MLLNSAFFPLNPEFLVSFMKCCFYGMKYFILASKEFCAPSLSMLIYNFHGNSSKAHLCFVLKCFSFPPQQRYIFFQNCGMSMRESESMYESLSTCCCCHNKHFFCNFTTLVKLCFCYVSFYLSKLYSNDKMKTAVLVYQSRKNIVGWKKFMVKTNQR